MIEVTTCAYLTFLIFDFYVFYPIIYFDLNMFSFFVAILESHLVSEKVPLPLLWFFVSSCCMMKYLDKANKKTVAIQSIQPPVVEIRTAHLSNLYALLLCLRVDYGSLGFPGLSKECEWDPIKQVN